MKRFLRKRSVRVAFILLALALCFWKPILAHTTHHLAKWTYHSRYAPGQDLYIVCFADTEIITFGGRFGIDDLRRFADDASLARQGRDRARAAVSYYDSGYFASDMVEHSRRSLAEWRERERYWRFNPEYWAYSLRADYIEYLAEGAPRRADYSHVPAPTWPPAENPTDSAETAAITVP
jgi:hypothetical protein